MSLTKSCKNPKPNLKVTRKSPESHQATWSDPYISQGCEAHHVQLQVAHSRFAFVLLIRPEVARISPVALLCLGGAAVMGLEIVIIKMLSSREDVFQILLINNAIAAIVATAPCFHLRDAECRAMWGRL